MLLMLIGGSNEKKRPEKYPRKHNGRTLIRNSDYPWVEGKTTQLQLPGDAFRKQAKKIQTNRAINRMWKTTKRTRT